MTRSTRMSDRAVDLERYRLERRYEAGRQRVFLTGLQAVARGVLDCARSDRTEGQRTGTFISGYPGSPLGGMEGVFRSLGGRLDELDIVLQPGVNEELAATAVLGATKRTVYEPGPFDGVTGVWYGKCNGVDRCVDVFKYGNYGGMGPGDAVVVLAGDDANVKSSGIPGESEHTLAAAGIPVLYPSSVPDIYRMFRHAVAMSRLSGCWVALKLATDLCDGGATMMIDPDGFTVTEPGLPEGFTKYDTSFYFGGPILDGEDSLFGPRHEVVRRYTRSNGIDRTVVSSDDDAVAVVASGKTFTDVRAALAGLGMDDERLRASGIRLIQVGLIYPLDAEGLISSIGDVSRVLVVEEKRGIIEQQLRSAYHHDDRRPSVVGKADRDGHPLVPRRGELDVDSIRDILRGFLGLARETGRRIPVAAVGDSGQRRTPNYCSGCPHSRATVSPQGTLTLGGIGCHSIGLFIEQPERHYELNVQMGGEGAPWVGAQPFVGTDHVIQNVGDGTYFHSASQAIRACVEASRNITFRLLYNGHISMTGGQEIPGTRGVAALTTELEAIGVSRTIVVTERPRELGTVAGNATVVDEGGMATALQELSNTDGVTVLLHDRECALERRRRWRRTGGRPHERIVIHERICEGCGDCGREANCPSLEPVETEFGRKTRIQQSSCSFDRACLAGDCPSFVSIQLDGSETRRRRPPDFDLGRLPAPPVRPETSIYSVGIGGTGVSTVTAVLAQAALMEGLWAVTLDQTGLAQRGGPVATHLITSASADRLHANKIPEGGADLLLAFDALESVQEAKANRASRSRTALVADRTITPTGQMIRDVWAPPSDPDRLISALEAITRPDEQVVLPARHLAEHLFGDHMKANLIAIGAASQSGFMPASPGAIEAAIALNGVDVDDNLAAFRYGRRWVADQGAVEQLLQPRRTDPLSRLPKRDEAWLMEELASSSVPTPLRDVVARRAADLVDYAGRRELAVDYLGFVSKVAGRDPDGDAALTRAVAENYHKLLAYKDEYEVARQYLDPDWRRWVRQEFGGGARVSYHLHPPVLRALGLHRKIRFGPWFDLAFRLLRSMRRTRGTWLDPFRYGEVRRLERELPSWYRQQVVDAVGIDSELALAVARVPEAIRGYESIKLDNAREAMRGSERMRQEAVSGTRSP